MPDTAQGTRAASVPVRRLSFAAGAALRDLAARHSRALALDLRPGDRPMPWAFGAALLALHVLGLLAIVRLSHETFWLALLPALLILPLLTALRLRGWRLYLESLAPLGLAYAVLGLRLALALVARLHAGAPGPLHVPQAWGRLLNFNLATGFSALWTILAQLGLLLAACGRRPRWSAVFGYAALLAAVAWAAVAYLTVAAKGVTASDPYAYVQMAVDLAQHGTPQHSFGLARQVAGWGLPVWPVVPVGYRPPDVVTGLSATVWPPGASALLALAYRLGGEAGLNLLTPLLGLAALLATWLLGLEVLRSWPPGRRRLAAGLAVAILATSYIQVRNLAVPMADVPSQLCTTLAVYAALVAARARPAPRRALWAVLAGLCLGAAFAIRYTQVLAAAAVLAAWLGAWSAAPPGAAARSDGFSRSRRAWLLPLACFAVAAWLPALPVLWYHHLAFGRAFSVGSGELPLLGWQNMPQSFVAVARELLRTNEFFYLSPFLAWGAWRLWRTARRPALVLLIWLAAITVFHLSYSALRARDLLSVFPVLALWAGAGMADIVGRAAGVETEGSQPGEETRPQHAGFAAPGLARPGAPAAGLLAAPRGPDKAPGKAPGEPRAGAPAWRAAAALLAALLVVAALWARTNVTLELASGRVYFNTFGYLRAEQREAFATLARLTPPDAIVAASLNAGPVGLYAGRDAVRPAYWSSEDWLAFVARARAAGRRVYVLLDGDEVQERCAALAAGYRLVAVATLPLPYFSPNGGSDNRDVPLYEVDGGP